MRITKKSITAAIKPATIKGTKFYAATINDLIGAFSGDKDNVWIKAAFEEDGFDAINFKNSLLGSKVIDETLYICETDGMQVDIDNYEYDPEKILDEVDVSDIEDMIETADDDIIHKYISEYELNTPDFDKLGVKLLNDGVKFKDLVSGYEEFDI